jgi:hypothetical protein
VTIADAGRAAVPASMVLFGGDDLIDDARGWRPSRLALRRFGREAGWPVALLRDALGRELRPLRPPRSMFSTRARLLGVVAREMAEPLDARRPRSLRS